MPKDKAIKHKIKVEELPQEEVKEPEQIETTFPEDLPKVTSFSQLDTPKLEEKVDKVEESETKPATPEESEEGKDETITIKESVDVKEKQVSSDEVKKWLSEVRPDTSKEVEKTSGPNLKIVISIVFALLVLGAVVGGVIYYKRNVTQENQSNKQSQIQVTSTPVPTKTPDKVDLSSFSLSVLNGSGTRGEAKNVMDLLKSEGFSEDKIDTGNADSYEYTSSSVSLKKDIPEGVYNAIFEILKDKYEVIKSQTTLEEDSSYDVIIIVGDKKVS